MTIITHDWEFFENGSIILPISAGFVAKNPVDGKRSRLYIVHPEAMERANKSEWLKANVKPQLLCSDFPKVIANSEKEFKGVITDWIDSWEVPQLWAWYGAYDHVALAQSTGGPMINMPDCIPKFTNDIKTLEFIATTNLKRYPDSFNSFKANYPEQNPLTEHHALEDAEHDMDLYEYFIDCI